MLLSITMGISICLVFGFALIQIALTLGAPIGEYALGGVHKVLPLKLRIVSGFFSTLWVVVGFSYLQRVRMIVPIFNNTFVNVLLIVYTVFLTYSIIGNGLITKSKKEKYLMTPLSIIGFISRVLSIVMLK